MQQQEKKYQQRCCCTACCTAVLLLQILEIRVKQAASISVQDHTDQQAENLDF